ncbi:MAG: hypothetical protein KQH63_18185 [Desulfobulbaceae bacterium]|nr:hypothetical protein [Desulfobulbaceae bacterium]
MSKQLSFTKIENELLPEFRKKIGTAESTEDVKKFYVYTMQNLFRQAFSGKIDLEYNDIELTPDNDPPFFMTEKFKDEADFSSTWNASDLPHVISRFTESAVNRYRHLEKKPEKTEAKIRM